MNRATFKRLSSLRLEDAGKLLAAKRYAGAYYLMGYAVECALKACVAKQVNQYDFPDKKLAQKAFTHDLEQLVKVAGLAPAFEKDRNANKALDLNWAVAKDWDEEARYKLEIGEAQARDLFRACTDKNGVLPWVRKQW